jgi:molybdate transport system substrate-binding protein
VRAALGAVLAAATLGCGSAAPENAVTVFAAASLADVFPRIEPRARYSFAGSDELALQLREGAPADVYAAADAAHAAALHEEGLVREPRVVATNRLVLIVPTDNPAGLRSVHDLAAKRAALVIGAEGVPVGEYARDALRNVGLERVLAHVVSEERDAKAVAAKVALGEADAGLVYATDVAPIAARVRVVELPPRAQPRIEYAVALVSSSEHETQAEAFVARLLGPGGQAEFRAAGFGVP